MTRWAKARGAASLSQTDLERAKLAAFRFVDAAYDFEGKGPSERLDYLGDVGRPSTPRSFGKVPRVRALKCPIRWPRASTSTE